MKEFLTMVWKYTKDAWSNPFGRVQFIFLFVEVLILGLTLYFFNNLITLLLLIFILPIGEELRMRNEKEDIHWKK